MLKFKDLTAAAQKAAAATAASIKASEELQATLNKLVTTAQGLPTLKDGDIVKIEAQCATILSFTDQESGKTTKYFAFPADIVRDGKIFRQINIAAASFVRGAYVESKSEPKAGSIEISDLKPRFAGHQIEFVTVDGVQLPVIDNTELKIVAKSVWQPDFANNAFQKGSTTVHAWKEKKDWGVTL